MRGRVLVIGTGSCGLFASYLLASRGWGVIAVGRGTSASAMSTGCLRHAPESEEAFDEFMRLMGSNGLPMVGPGTGITNLGTRFDCSLAPKHSIWEGEMPNGIAVLGIGRHPSLRPKLSSSILSSWAHDVQDANVEMEVLPEAPLSVAFPAISDIDRLADRLKEVNSEAVLLPPIFKLDDYGRLDRLEHLCGRRLLEAITPLGIPGQRFHEALIRGAIGAGARIWAGRKVSSLIIDGDTVTGADVQGGLESRRIEVDSVLMATGGPLVDGVLLGSEGPIDPFNAFLMNGGDSIHSGYAHAYLRLRAKDGREMTNVFGGGDCLSSERRTTGNGLSLAIDDAWNAVHAMEGA